MPRLVISLNDAVVKEVALDNGRTVIGRRPFNDLILEHPTVSGEHAAIEVDGEEAVVEDLNSTNGTHVNGVRVERHAVTSSDIIEIGRYQIQYFSDAQTVPSELAETDEPARLRVLSGASMGQELVLTKPVVTLGKKGTSVVSITRKRQGYQLAWIEGDLIPEVNGVSVASGPILLCHRDQIVIGQTRLAYLDR